MASVLVINHDPSALTTMTASLRCAGVDAAAADAGRSGIALASERPFDVILVELRLPDITGIEVVRSLKGRGVSARMVIVTAFPSFHSAFEAGAEGADGYVDGPLLDDEVVGIVRRAMDQGPAGPGVPATRRLTRAGGDGPAAEPGPTIDPRIREVMRIIQDGMAGPLAIGHLARRVDLSESRLRHLFTAGVRTTISKYILERRLATAARRLTSTFEHVRQIGFGVGLNDVRFFRKAFRSQYGLSPKAYRQAFGRRPPRRSPIAIPAPK